MNVPSSVAGIRHGTWRLYAVKSNPFATQSPRPKVLFIRGQEEPSE
jgi:hypothetical protein